MYQLANIAKNCLMPKKWKNESYDSIVQSSTEKTKVQEVTEKFIIESGIKFNKSTICELIEKRIKVLNDYNFDDLSILYQISDDISNINTICDILKKSGGKQKAIEITSSLENLLSQKVKSSVENKIQSLTKEIEAEVEVIKKAKVKKISIKKLENLNETISNINLTIQIIHATCLNLLQYSEFKKLDAEIIALNDQMIDLSTDVKTIQAAKAVKASKHNVTVIKNKANAQEKNPTATHISARRVMTSILGVFLTLSGLAFSGQLPALMPFKLSNGYIPDEGTALIPFTGYIPEIPEGSMQSAVHTGITTLIGEEEFFDVDKETRVLLKLPLRRLALISNEQFNLLLNEALTPKQIYALVNGREERISRLDSNKLLAVLPKLTFEQINKFVTDTQLDQLPLQSLSEDVINALIKWKYERFSRLNTKQLLSILPKLEPYMISEYVTDEQFNELRKIKDLPAHIIETLVDWHGERISLLDIDQLLGILPKLKSDHIYKYITDSQFNALPLEKLPDWIIFWLIFEDIVTPDQKNKCLIDDPLKMFQSSEPIYKIRYKGDRISSLPSKKLQPFLNSFDDQDFAFVTTEQFMGLDVENLSPDSIINYLRAQSFVSVKDVNLSKFISSLGPRRFQIIFFNKLGASPMFDEVIKEYLTEDNFKKMELEKLSEEILYSIFNVNKEWITRLDSSQLQSIIKTVSLEHLDLINDDQFQELLKKDILSQEVLVYLLKSKNHRIALVDANKLEPILKELSEDCLDAITNEQMEEFRLGIDIIRQKEGIGRKLWDRFRNHIPILSPTKLEVILDRIRQGRGSYDLLKAIATDITREQFDLLKKSSKEHLRKFLVKIKYKGDRLTWK